MGVGGIPFPEDCQTGLSSLMAVGWRFCSAPCHVGLSGALHVLKGRRLQGADRPEAGITGDTVESAISPELAPPRVSASPGC